MHGCIRRSRPFCSIAHGIVVVGAVSDTPFVYAPGLTAARHRHAALLARTKVKLQLVSPLNVPALGGDFHARVILWLSLQKKKS
jgi:hypothetical protein